ncbi:MAG: hypothetical protein ACQGVK_19385 [Myxococcota bacterium]
MGKAVAALGFGLALAVASVQGPGCATVAPAGPEAAPADRAGHLGESATLRRRMRELAVLSRTRMPKELDLGIERDERREALQASADELAVAAGLLARTPPPAGLSELRAERFRSLAEALRDRALEITLRARSADSSALFDSLAALDATCNQCHREFGVTPFAPEADPSDP